jgi:protein ImuB
LKRYNPVFAVIYIPNFALQAAFRHDPDSNSRPVALMDSDPAQKEIFQVNATARSFGVEEGLTAVQATARCGDLLIKVRSSAAEKACGEILLQTAYTCSPNLEATQPGVCTIDLKGLPLKTESGQRSWAEKIIDAISVFNLAAQIGIAITPNLALLAARGAGRVNVVADVDRFIDKLPVSALDPPPDIAAILGRWGIRRVGELIALNRDQLGERLGAPILSLLDFISPNAVRPLRPAAPPAEFAEEMDFENEIETIAPLLFSLRRFVEQLSRRLEMLCLVVAELRLQLRLGSGKYYERTLKVPAPTGQVEILFRMLQTHLESLRTDAPIIALRLVAVPATPDAHQFGLFENTLRDPNQFAETLARLSALCGSERIGTPTPLSTHRPDSFSMRSPDFDSPAHSNGAQRKFYGPALRRFRPPQTVRVEFHDGKPVRVNGGDFGGPVINFAGPFLASGNWWDRDTWAREEWDVETRDGVLLRVFRAKDACFVEGVYD